MLTTNTSVHKNIATSSLLPWCAAPTPTPITRQHQGLAVLSFAVPPRLPVLLVLLRLDIKVHFLIFILAIVLRKSVFTCARKHVGSPAAVAECKRARARNRKAGAHQKTHTRCARVSAHNRAIA